MAKGKSDLFSKLSGHFSKADNMTLRTRDDNIIIEKYPKPSYTRSPAQDEQRTLYSLAVKAWHAASDEEREEYRPIAKRKQITLYNAFISSKLIGELPEGAHIIRVDNIENSSNLTDYQILLSISSDSQFFSDLSFSLDHIEIYDTDKETALPFWVESSSSEEFTAKIWIKVPEIPASSRKKIYLIPNLERTEPLSDFSATFTKNYGESNLAGLWHLDEGTGTTISDSSGNNNTGTCTSPDWMSYDGGQWAGRSDISFPPGACLRIRYLNDYITIPHSTSLNLSDSFTVESWVKTSSKTKQTIIEKYASGGGFALYIYDSGVVSLNGFNGAGSYTQNTGTTDISDGNWHHIAASIDGGIWKIYIDGTLEKTLDTGYDESSISNSSEIAIGIHILSGSNLLVGEIDEIRVHTRVLPLLEIKAHYERRKYSFPEPAIFHYRA